MANILPYQSTGVPTVQQSTDTTQPIVPAVRNCRKISDADCVGYFFEEVCQKT